MFLLCELQFYFQRSFIHLQIHSNHPANFTFSHTHIKSNYYPELNKITSLYLFLMKKITKTTPNNQTKNPLLSAVIVSASPQRGAECLISQPIGYIFFVHITPCLCNAFQCSLPQSDHVHSRGIIAHISQDSVTGRLIMCQEERQNTSEGTQLEFGCSEFCH